MRTTTRFHMTPLQRLVYQNARSKFHVQGLVLHYWHRDQYYVKFITHLIETPMSSTPIHKRRLEN